MTRLASIEKGGYYPTQPPITELILKHLRAPHGGRILDPCAGKGAALLRIAGELGLEIYANELNTDRARLLRQNVLDLRNQDDYRQSLVHTDPHALRVVHGDVADLDASPGFVNLAFVNPPYDYDRDEGRLEYVFLKHATRWLQPGGVLVYIVPFRTLRHKKIARYLASWYGEPLAARYPDPEYNQFNQFVFFGYRNEKKQVPDEWIETKLHSLDPNAPATLKVSTTAHSGYFIPPIRRKSFTFRSNFFTYEDIAPEIETVGIQHDPELHKHVHPQPDALQTFRPLMPLKIGHLASLIAAGFLDNQILESEDGERLLISGRSVKHTKEEKIRTPKDDGGEKVKTVRTEYATSEITAITPEGDIRWIKPEDLPGFLKQWLPQLTEAVANTYDPIYQFDTGVYGERIGNRGTLFPTQKHIAAAVSLRLDKHADDAIIVGEMGTGKTRTASAVIPAIDARRTLVACPPHLYKKWMREASIVNPDAHIMYLKTVSDVDRWMQHDEEKKRTIGVMKFTTARAASGWDNAVDYWQLFSHEEEKLMRKLLTAEREGKPLPTLPPKLQRKMDLYKPWLRLMQSRGMRCPTSGHTLLDKDGFILPFSALNNSNQRSLTITPTEQGKGAYCALYQFTRWGSGPMSNFKEHAEIERRVRHHLANQGITPWNNRPTDAFRTARNYPTAKVPLADYIMKHYRAQIDLLIADEVQKLKGKDSDQGYALHRLANVSRKVLSLTGTIFGGYASNLFYILYRTADDHRRAFTDDSQTGRRRIRARDWIDTYGMRKTTEVKHLNANGKQTGNTKAKTSYREAPGSSPKMLPWLLNRSAFMSLRDIGFPLPDYEEIPVILEMAPGQKRQMSQIEATLGEEMRQALVQGDQSLLSTYLWTMLSVPDAPWRKEVIEDPRTKDNPKPRVITTVQPLPADRLYPKEEAIIDLIKKEVEQKRYVMLLCQQTDKRNIQPQWKRMLEEHGLRPAILTADADRREAWIDRQAKSGTNVIISHPKKVETGLDIMDYPTIIWMGTEYSAYTVMQASRRSWRIGQDKPVKVYFFVYQDTLQERALHLTAKKIAAAVHVNGDIVATNSVADMGGGSLRNELSMMIERGEATNGNDAGIKDLQALFAEANAAMQTNGHFIGHEMPAEPAPAVTIGPRKASEVAADDDFVALPTDTPETADPVAGTQLKLVFGMSLKKAKEVAEERDEPATPPPQQYRQVSLFDALA